MNECSHDTSLLALAQAAKVKFTLHPPHRPTFTLFNPKQAFLCHQNPVATANSVASRSLRQLAQTVKAPLLSVWFDSGRCSWIGKCCISFAVFAFLRS
jgi:hypothetical protein